MAARQGGDEFTVLLARIRDVAEAIVSADRLLAELRRPIEVDGRRIVVGGSMGIAMAGGRDMVADDLLAHADAAMYAAKAAGKDRHAVFDPSMRVRAWHLLETGGDLRLPAPRLVEPLDQDSLSEAG